MVKVPAGLGLWRIAYGEKINNFLLFSCSFYFLDFTFDFSEISKLVYIPSYL